MGNPGRRFVAALAVVFLLAGCGRSGLVATPVQVNATPAVRIPLPASPQAGSPTPAPVEEPAAAGLSADEIGTLSSLAQVDNYPLYVMHYQGSYRERPSASIMDNPPAWACSLFAALGNPDDRLYGRNFDWDFSPALLLFADPPDGYASVSMVDIAYLGFGGSKAHGLADLPLGGRKALLDAPFLPFDGMNEHGLAVGMAAVPAGGMRPDPNKETIGSLGVIREMLDRARNVAEALTILQSYNVEMEGGPPIHYLIADPSGRSLLIEFYQGEMVVTPNEAAWHQATNFLRAASGDTPEGQCWRYDKIQQHLAASQGRLTAQEATDLLAGVAQPATQWSIVYGMSSGDVQVTMGRQYEALHTFHLDLSQ
jgi:uncharacterized protein YceK